MTFKKWMKRHLNANNLTGDLAYEICDDKDFPNTNDFSKALQYLKDNHADENRLKVLKNSWILYIESIFTDSED